MKKKMQKGFSLVELMVVIAIIAILAAVAIPMYSNYTTRAKIGTVLSAVGGVKSEIAEQIMNQGNTTNVSSSGSTFNGSTLPSSSGASLAYTTAVANGTITMTLTTPVSGNIVLEPNYDPANGAMTWTCTGSAGNGNNAMTASQLPSPCDFTA
ncbi:prepilin-type N-terminal cleavage/methylation domain-containing protein [Francisella philomiragia]|uniref:Type IV pili fiber building block protein n=1 Tax=Francisella philomiragia subsp. philomiragia (strain ATCC 25017 / CCUG 19701 / FSC 153 / O\|nr:prepilin-type N-terminal cleavage/methylation domain-containing protein [Francisella philomiragia]AJI46762.1 type IV pilin [Francisella philomiragia]AJI49398.1 type IV pilin [Francisella philomiragia]MBK2021369.1 prepilin-type N-terminal cleavage/methylation domain-containing protein [Francisella philomiragia]MBK2031343.1 prepilin-type N-terminal cleavage/methylation domain-containing protein [Francisella philomiragia]MBK2264229.1 prepilin-type N-terminal cleavage/methylation domain-contain